MMGRPKEFPEEHYAGMSKEGNLCLPEPNEPPLGFLMRIGSARLAKYALVATADKQVAKQHKKAPKPVQPPIFDTLVQLHKPQRPAVATDEPDNAPQTQPDERDHTGSEWPSIITEPKKRKRRMKAEIRAANSLNEAEKPKWKCSCWTCLWKGDTPPKSTKGLYVGKLVCPKCGALVIENE